MRQRHPVLALLDVQLDDTSWLEMDPAERRRTTLEVCRTLILQEAQVQPLIVIFVDLHWVDAET